MVNLAARPTVNVSVVANCHCLPIADALALCGRFVSTDFIDVNSITRADVITKIELLVSHPPDIVFSQPLSDGFGRISTKTLREKFGSSLVTFTNIHFTGLHPDITYLGTIGQRLQGSFGDYHSKLVLFSFVTQRSVEACLGLFGRETFDRIGYFAAFEESSQSLRAREATCDVRFAEEFLAMAQRVPTLYTINHPTGAVFLALAEALCKHADLTFNRHNPEMFQNHLATNFIWPIYDEIAEYHGLDFRTLPLFVTGVKGSSRSLTLEEFVAGSYEAYAQVPLPEIAQVVTRMPFYMDFAQKLGV